MAMPFVYYRAYMHCLSVSLFKVQLAQELRAEWMASKEPQHVDVPFTDAEQCREIDPHGEGEEQTEQNIL